MRNPWRFSFDRATGELWIGDVGQNSWEEIDVVESGRPGPVNFGWRTMEGLHCYDPKSGCDAEGLHLPVYEYGHDEGCSVTGGYVYRGRALPDLTGKYLFSDYCTGEVQALARTAEGVTKRLLQFEILDTQHGQNQKREDEHRPAEGTIEPFQDVLTWRYPTDPW